GDGQAGDGVGEDLDGGQGFDGAVLDLQRELFAGAGARAPGGADVDHGVGDVDGGGGGGDDVDDHGGGEHVKDNGVAGEVFDVGDEVAAALGQAAEVFEPAHKDHQAGQVSDAGQGSG